VSAQRSYFYDYRYSSFRYSRTNSFKDTDVAKKPGDGYATCIIDRWSDGAFQSHYQKNPLFWSRTVIRHKRLIESQLWDKEEKERLLALGLNKELESEVCSYFQSLIEEKQRVDDLSEKIKLAFQGELDADTTAPPRPPVLDHEFHALRVKLRYFARAASSNVVASIFESGLKNTRNKLNYIHVQYPTVTLRDFDVLSFVAALEVAKGPCVPFRFGRTEEQDFLNCIPDPMKQTPDEIRSMFPKEFTDLEIVALCGLNYIPTQGVVDAKYYTEVLSTKTGALFKDPVFKDIAEKFTQSPAFFKAMLYDAVLRQTEFGVKEEQWCEY